MVPMNRRGFTIAQLIVGIVTSSVVLTGVFRAVLSTQRNSQALAQRIDVQQNVRAAAYYLGTVLRELDATDGDVISLANDALLFRSMRWVGVLCDVPTKIGNDVFLPLRPSQFFGFEGPDASIDSVLIFRDGDTGTRTDDRWLPGGVQSINAGVCSDGSVATRLRVGVDVSEGGADSVLIGVTEGAPLRGFQVAELKTLVDGKSRSWIGRRVANRAGSWTAAEPFIGPLAPSGFRLGFFDRDGNPTANPVEIASLSITVRGESMGRAGRFKETIRDSLGTRVALRNNRRF